jgi:hypothetical protein
VHAEGGTVSMEWKKGHAERVEMHSSAGASLRIRSASRLSCPVMVGESLPCSGGVIEAIVPADGMLVLTRLG